ncbi:hypothetical protein SCHPADRAFT_945938 [Schizopora paradoxa]|uniref:C2H2-type domain-containing protein n=1 Tax=Schizopora paradoxa TaxID=27342 RepID=A0A0H2R5L0_9AGAM|nr:hypothetical protein SCHPADRAFT_945938 [Schizopora paradoxa]
MVTQSVKISNARKRVVCDIASCGKTFQRTFDLNRHKATHLSETEKEKLMHRCTYPGCTKAMLQKSNIDLHYKTHLDIKDDRCQFCNNLFADASSLIRHEKNVHNYYRKQDKTRARRKPKTLVLPGQETFPRPSSSPTSSVSSSPPSSTSSWLPSPSLSPAPIVANLFDKSLSLPRISSSQQLAQSLPPLLEHMRMVVGPNVDILQSPRRTAPSGSSIVLPISGPSNPGPSRVGNKSPSDHFSVHCPRNTSSAIKEVYLPEIDDWVRLTPNPSPPFLSQGVFRNPIGPNRD